MVAVAPAVAAIWVCTAGFAMRAVFKQFPHNEQVQVAITRGLSGPAMLMLSFLVLDRCISFFETDPECGADDPHDSTACLMVVVVFVTLIVHSLADMLAAKQKSLSAIYMVVIHAMIAVVYGQMYLGVGSGVLLWRTSYGSMFKPARVNLWAHSSMAQVLSLSAVHNADQHGIKQVLDCVSQVYLMFVLGFLATMRPPAVLSSALGPVFSGTALLVAAPILTRTVLFLYKTIPLSMHIPAESEASAWSQMLTSKILPSITVLTWLLFPCIWVAAAIKVITPLQEALLFTCTDVVAKAAATLALQCGNMASCAWQERTEQSSLLQASQSVVAGFKLFTKCVGHDLRTPMQALIFSNLKARELTQQMIHQTETKADVNEKAMSEPERVAVDTTPSTRDTLALSRTVAGQASVGNVSGSEVAPTEAATEADSRLQLLNDVLQKQEEVGACAELITCIVSNIWDFEMLSMPDEVGDQAAATAELPEEVNINEVVNTVIEMLRKSSLYKPNVLLRSLCDEMIPEQLFGNRSILVRGLLNLTSNALKFTETGHVSLHTRLVSDLSQRTIRVRFDVIDTGSGMTEEQICDARKPYVSGVQNGVASGLGLGLTIVISSIERAGGTFDISSRKGSGSTFSFELAFAVEDPMLEGRTEKSISNAFAKRGVTSRSKTVAIIDDVEMIRRGVADVLESYGHKVRHESDGVAGLEMLKSGAAEIDVALVDIQMPGICGDELIVYYRKWESEHRPSKRRMRVYACTGNATSTDSHAYVRAGFDGCVSKPVYPQTLKALLSDSSLIVQSALVAGSACGRSSPSSGCPSSGHSSASSTPPSPHNSLFSTPLGAAMASPAKALSLNATNFLLGGQSPVSAKFWSHSTRPREAPEHRQSDAMSATIASSRGARGASDSHERPLQDLCPKPVGGMSPLHEGQSQGSSISSSPTVSAVSLQAGKKRSTQLLQRIERELSDRYTVDERAQAVKHASSLPACIIAGQDMTAKLGYSASQAQQMIERFKPYLAQQQELMQAALDAQAWAPTDDVNKKSVRSIAHAVKGAAGMVCAQRLAEASKSLQMSSEKCGNHNYSAEEHLMARADSAVWQLELDRMVNLISAIPASKLIQSCNNLEDEWASRQ